MEEVLMEEKLNEGLAAQGCPDVSERGPFPEALFDLASGNDLNLGRCDEKRPRTVDDGHIHVKRPSMGQNRSSGIFTSA
ncbi:hypothetical protein EYF80_023302 [Liparis tanakae]|uniref:Uncharacterized protein n=1 Tax=Liparis tanakae TaxID=230148 RepID=A0A4Z2HKU5_9TELE|nr:hypothetical protein EYF80_023302 [Liparis tanakae]